VAKDWLTDCFGRLLLLAILQDDRQLYAVEQLFDDRRFGNLELAESAIKRTLRLPLQFFNQRLVVAFASFCFRDNRAGSECLYFLKTCVSKDKKTV
jgi:hypothetical protein